MQAALGCAVCSDTKKDEWFVQLRVPPEAALFEPVILTSTFAIGREAAIEKARGLAGVDEVIPWSIYSGRGAPGIVQQQPKPKLQSKRRAGLIAELARLEAACDALRAEINKHHDEI